ncbi:CMGC/SRPK protein kinase [Arthroderma uncinatum]|uniref:CMGC/SRPK protein kinase n=1 Tax=Arthroderma uncinatum TaxID=74035 RepID=UPI00144AE168|nr:CMGC/SRPK protein kinase [Arthroderma uncinatum]KAF3491769.1 CMGC/SRPK protein kinase [Arthroderma uncinatum]
MRMSLLEMMGLNSRPFDLPLLKMTVRRLLSALDFFHTEAEIIHADLKTDNLMLSLEDTTAPADFANAEVKNPSPRKKINESRIVYESRKFLPPVGGKGYGLPVLCDFGEARIGKTHESSPLVQPTIYRAPEIIFEMPWGSAVDIWNLAGLIWDLFEGEHLFGNIFDAKGGHDPFKHLALVVVLIGRPSSEFVRRSETTAQYFDPSGGWIAHEDAVIPSVSLESLEKRLSGKERDSFLQFMGSMLKWLPEERSTAKQLLKDPWLL